MECLLFSLQDFLQFVTVGLEKRRHCLEGVLKKELNVIMQRKRYTKFAIRISRRSLKGVAHQGNVDWKEEINVYQKIVISLPRDVHYYSLNKVEVS